jgi:hypothetical protein
MDILNEKYSYLFIFPSFLRIAFDLLLLITGCEDPFGATFGNAADDH